MRLWPEPPTSDRRRSTETGVLIAPGFTPAPAVPWGAAAPRAGLKVSPASRSKVRREFPDHPVVGVGGVVIRSDSVLLIRRGSEPLKGQWSIPGGVLELGESLEAGVRRELKEETGLAVRPIKVIAAFDRILRSEPAKNHRVGRVRYHFVIVDYACRVVRGRLTPGSDVTDARWVRRCDLGRYHLTAMAQSVVRAAFEVFPPEARRPR